MGAMMFRDTVNSVATVAAVLFLCGWVWSMIEALRLKKPTWCLALFFAGAIAYPLFAFIYRKASPVTFHLFWTSSAVFLVCLPAVIALNPVNHT